MTKPKPKEKIKKSQRMPRVQTYSEGQLKNMDWERRERLYVQAFERIKQIQDIIDHKEAKDSYAKYVALTHKYDKAFKIAPFQVYLCELIQRFLADELTNEKGIPYDGLTISMPSQHGKSRCVTETLPSWFLGNNPSRHVIEISYNENFAERFGRRNIEKVQEFGKSIFNIELATSKTSATEFEIKRSKGGMLSKGLGGGISGYEGDLIIVDDPYKGRTDADSPSYNKFVLDEWYNVVVTRMSARCKTIVIHTRWNTDDLIGYLLEAQPKSWYEIKFPLIAEKHEPVIGRRMGDALLPEAGKDNEWAQKHKKKFLSDPKGGGLRAWNSLMQQRPVNIEGNMIKREFWRRYDLSLEMQKDGFMDRVAQSWDCAFKDMAEADFVAGGVWGKSGSGFYLMDVFHEQVGIVRTMKAIKDMIEKWPHALARYIEEKANGEAVMQMMKATVSGLIPVTATKSKAERVNTVLPLFEAGNIYIPQRIEVQAGVWEHCRWADAVIEECAEFDPLKKTQKDDLVDMTTQGLMKMMYDFTAISDTERAIGFASPLELEDMGVKPGVVRPRSTVVSW